MFLGKLSVSCCCNFFEGGSSSSEINGHQEPLVYFVIVFAGDGNFAVVKQCHLKNTKTEFAMKVIDKKKLKGT